MRCCLVVTAIVLGLSSLGLAQTTWYVDEDNCPGPGSGTPDDPFCRIQAAIDAALRGDTVLVLPGTYFENILLQDRGITLRSDADGDPATHDPDPALTVIDGQRLDSVVTFASISALEDSRLEGFTITNGRAQLGAGIHCDGNTAPVVSGNVIAFNQTVWTDPQVGGGIYLSHSSAWICGNTIADNQCLGNGAGIAILSQSTARITENRILANCGIAGLGGGIYCESSTAEVVGNTISGNLTYNKFLDAHGAGLCCVDSQVIVNGNVFTGNLVTASEGDGNGGAVSCIRTAGTVVGNIICGNQAFGYGGGISCTDGSPSIRDNLVCGNFAYYGGGAIHCGQGSRPVVATSVLAGNDGYDYGGGLYCEGASPTFDSTILWDNNAPRGSQIYLGTRYRPSTLTISYADAEGGRDAVHVDPDCSLDWGPGMIDADPLYPARPPGTWTQDGHYDSATYQITLIDDTANWTVNELAGLLINPAVGELRLQFLVVGNTATTVTVWADRYTIDSNVWMNLGDTYQLYDYHLTPASPCIDTGDPADQPCTDRDLYGNPRYLDGHLDLDPRIDIGMQEFDNVHLAVSGEATPGSLLTLTTSGTAGLVVYLFVGCEPGATCIPLYGALYVDTASPWWLLFWGAIPAPGSYDVGVTIPGQIPTPMPLVLQELAMKVPLSAGNMSNPVELTIE